MREIIKRLFCVVLAVLVFSGVAGCSANTGDRKSSSAREDVIIGFPVIPAHFDPLRTVADGHTGGLLLFSTLVDTDADMNIIPDLAESYRISEDGLTYTFKLRRDARFTDGVGVTAADVVFSYQRVMNNATATDLTMVKQVAADGDEVIINLSKPWSPFLLTVAQVGIVPEHAYGPDFGLNPIGSGPFKLVQLDVEQQFILEANEEYYGKIPEIKRFVFVKMSNEDIQFAAAKSGQVDITLTSAVLAAVNDIPGYSLLIKDSLDNMGLAMPTIPDTRVVNRYGRSVGNNITHQVSFRQALAYGLDREAICRDALNGFATPAYTENDGMPWSNPDSKIDYDLDYAIALLEGDGWLPGSDGIRTKEGLRASLPLIYSAGDSVRQAVAMAVAKQAKEKLGIELVVEGTSWDDISLRMYSEPLILAWGSANPMTSYYLFHSSRAGLDDFYNPQNFTNSVVDRYLEQAVSAGSLEEGILYFHKAQWDGVTGTSMRGECPYIFLINKSHLYWVRDGLDTGRQKIHAHGDAWPLIANLKEWKWQ